MEINKTTLKTIMSKFNSVSNRLLQSSYGNYLDDLRRFCNYIEANELIMEYIDSCGGFNSEMESLLDECLHQGGKIQFSIDEDEETLQIYSYIKTICDRDYTSLPPGIILPYSSSNKFADMLQEFNHCVVLALINHISDYLKKVGIEMGMDDNVTYNINGQQVNIANDNASITAIQNNNGIDVNELHKLVEAMKAGLSPHLSSEDKADAEESIDIIKAELSSGSPDEQKVKSQFKLLKRLDVGVKFASACCSLLTFADRVFPFLAEVAPFYQNLLK
ncbi:hypothetical protein DW015_03640 [Ruminococcus sp. AF37-20]|uniref:hypothetical protein n=1 Tax=Ruminococcus sp. AF37-20 TaxID=2293178 RepID=UPI000E474F0C|nr:hypothetical protein [Ruminococcus sp. AF37-20]RGF48838.1 hypothetical protein DW015_03640 [Ruminococcus sp. AF37-20]